MPRLTYTYIDPDGSLLDESIQYTGSKKAAIAKVEARFATPLFSIDGKTRTVHAKEVPVGTITAEAYAQIKAEDACRAYETRMHEKRLALRSPLEVGIERADLSDLQSISQAIARLQAKFCILKDEARNLSLGKHDSFTVYEVKATKVSGYKRRSYRAVRCVAERKGDQ